MKKVILQPFSYDVAIKFEIEFRGDKVVMRRYDSGRSDGDEHIAILADVFNPHAVLLLKGMFLSLADGSIIKEVK